MTDPARDQGITSSPPARPGLPVVTTKLFVPARRARFVARPRVAGRLDATLEAGHRLTIVSAPAGFGKTAALGAWLGGLDRPAGWLSLDAGDNDPARFLAHLAAALGVAGPVTDAAELVNAVASAGSQRVVVLDDYHVIEAAAVHEIVTFLLDHLPEDLRLVLAARSDPPLPLARLRGRGQLTEIRAADLRFTAGEAREFLNPVMGLELTAADVEALEDRTEGWVAGLQLAALSLRGLAGRDDITGFIRDFAGSDRFVIDYLADEVLARQPLPVRDFLFRTSILERLHGGLCDAVTGGTGGAEMLAGLERDNLFVVPLDTSRSWYRYHHLFADVLQARLAAEHPDLVPELHERAGAWFAANDRVADAIRHAMAAGNPGRAARLVEEALPDMRRSRQDGLLLGWIRALPDRVVRCNPVLSILAGWSAMVANDLDAAGSRLDDAAAALAAGDPGGVWADTSELRTAPATLAVYRASLAQAHGDVAGTVRHAQQALDLAGPDDHLVRGGAGGFLGLAAWAAGNVHDARSTFGDAVRSLHAAGNLVDELDSTVVLADMWVASGRPGRARRLYEQALATAEAGGEPYPRATADLHVGLAELDLQRDDQVAAEAHLESARTLGARGSITENRHRWYVVTAQLHAARGDHRAALALLDEAQARYRPGFYPDVRPIAALKARVQIGGGDLPAAIGWAEDQAVSADDDLDYLHEYEHLTLARLLLAQHRPESAAALLDRLRPAAVRDGRDGSVVEIDMLLALAYAGQGDRARALTALDRSFTGAPEPGGSVRLYLDQGAPMETLLRLAASAPARRLLERVAVPAAAPADPLSPRELEVLRLLDGELTGPEIARRMFVTVNTLRTHTKRIFTKLGVTTRAAAVRRAREQGLL